MTQLSRKRSLLCPATAWTSWLADEAYRPARGMVKWLRSAIDWSTLSPAASQSRSYLLSGDEVSRSFTHTLILPEGHFGHPCSAIRLHCSLRGDNTRRRPWDLVSSALTPLPQMSCVQVEGLDASHMFPGHSRGGR